MVKNSLRSTLRSRSVTELSSLLHLNHFDFDLEKITLNKPQNHIASRSYDYKTQNIWIQKLGRC